MKPTISWRSPLVCHFCASELRALRAFRTPVQRARSTPRSSPSPRTTSSTKVSRCFASTNSIRKVQQHDDEPPPKPLPNSKVVDERLKDAQLLANIVLQNPNIPSEDETLRALKAIESISQQIYEARISQKSSNAGEDTPASALLDLDSRAKGTKPVAHPLKKVIAALSSLAHELVAHPSVFITPDMLQTYVDTQAFLGRPGKIPEVFNLFASKPRPTQHKPGDTVVYKAQNPDSLASAVPKHVAFAALASAIAVHDLHTALTIIETSVATKSFRRNKIFRKAVPPIAVAALMPGAAYVLADQMALNQTEMDPEQFQMVAFAGIVTYLGTVGMLGMIAVTTANDQMERVVWVEGTPLRERWIREEERAMIDRVALGWGFKQESRWGEEEGDDWAMLKDWCGIRGMQVDKVSLMEGME